MFDFLKNKETLLTQELLKLQSKTTESSKNSNGFINVVSVLTLEEIDNKIAVEQLLKKTLKVKEVKIYSFRKFNKEVSVSSGFFTDKDINRKVKIENSDFNTFLNKEHGLLICLFDVNNLYLELASAISKATCKVGFANVNSNLFDIEISSSINNIDEFLLELNKYLQILNKLPKEENITAKTFL